MDFLDIRKKAQERARARAAAEAEARARDAGQPAAPASPPDAPSAVAPAPAPRRRRRSAKGTPPPDAPMVTDEDVLEGALAARLQGLPAPADPTGSPGPELDPRFTTWRPGSGEPPVVPREPEPSGEVLARPEDFAVVGSWGSGLVPAPLTPPSPWTTQPVEPQGAPAPADPLDEFFYREDEPGPALPEIAAAEPEPEAEPVLLAREEFLTFLLGADEYAVDIGRVREVVRPPPIAEVPHAPSHILGVVTVRGEVVAVLDPRRRLGLAPAQPDEGEGEGKIVIVDAGEGPVGLRVDRVASVVRLRAGSIEPCPQGIAGSRGEFLAGIGRDGERLFTVLDLTTLLRRAPARAEPGRTADA